jgi:DNA-binding Xre family transcriptional regulator
LVEEPGKIFELLRDRGMTQKEFTQTTGIAESSISDWKYALKEMKS